MLALLLCSSLAHAVAFGGSVLVGPVVTLPRTVTSNGTTVQFQPTAGPLGEVQIELGERFISSLVVQGSTVPIDADTGGIHASGRLNIALVGYRFTFDLFGREGKPPISPYVGVGTLLGGAAVSVSASDGGQTAVASGKSIALELDAVLGAHWRLADHFGLRAEVGVSSYGGFGAVQPRVGAYAKF